MKPVNHTNKRFGSLVAKSVKFSKYGNNFWECVCDCGNKTIVRSAYLVKGHTTSCGKHFAEKAKNQFTKHGMSRTRFYLIWVNIKSRCGNPKVYGFRNYGGRGIKCFWDTYESFHNDMYSSYQKHCELFGEKETTIDRIDNNGNYIKENCRWATRKEQTRNTRNSQWVTYQGQRKTIGEWAEIYGIDRVTLRQRIVRDKKSFHKAISY